MKSRSGEEVIRAKVLILKGDAVFAVCKGCGEEVPVPLQRKETQLDYGPDLYLDK